MAFIASITFIWLHDLYHKYLSDGQGSVQWDKSTTHLEKCLLRTNMSDRAHEGIAGAQG